MAVINRSLSWADTCTSEVSGLRETQSPALGKEGKEHSLSQYFMPNTVLSAYAACLPIIPLNPRLLTISIPILYMRIQTQGAE